jgi:hypothetical protein
MKVKADLPPSPPRLGNNPDKMRGAPGGGSRFKIPDADEQPYLRALSEVAVLAIREAIPLPDHFSWLDNTFLSQQEKCERLAAFTAEYHQAIRRFCQVVGMMTVPAPGDKKRPGIEEVLHTVFADLRKKIQELNGKRDQPVDFVVITSHFDSAIAPWIEAMEKLEKSRF